MARDTYALAEEIARAALPCPFCGERLVVATDHHGAWVEHRRSMQSDCFEAVAQIHDMAGLRGWNTRLPPPTSDGGGE